MSPYRELSPTEPRPALTLWQRALVATLGARRCARWRWYRAHVGGWWSRTTTLRGDARWVLSSRWPEMHAEVSGPCVDHRDCEVYAHAVAGAGPFTLIRFPRDQDPPEPGTRVISGPGAVLHVEEHVLSAEQRAALNIGRRGLR